VINEKFEALLTSFFYYIEKEKVNVNIFSLKSVLKGVIRQPTIYEDDDEFTSEDIRQLKVDDTSSKFAYIVRSYCSFFNFSLLEKLMKLAKYNDGLHMIEDYKKDFDKYLQEVNILEIPHGTGINGDESKLFVVELSDCFKYCRGTYINVLKRDLSRQLGIEENCLNLSIIKKTSIHVVFQVYQSLEIIFPLNDELKCALKNLSYENAQIVAIGYDGFVCNINEEGKNVFLKKAIFNTRFMSCCVLRNWQGK